MRPLAPPLFQIFPAVTNVQQIGAGFLQRRFCRRTQYLDCIPMSITCIPVWHAAASNDLDLKREYLSAAAERGYLSDGCGGANSLRELPALTTYQRRGSLQLWQFLIALLENPANTSFIAWTGRGLEFKLIEPEEVSIVSRSELYFIAKYMHVFDIVYQLKCDLSSRYKT